MCVVHIISFKLVFFLLLRTKSQFDFCIFFLDSIWSGTKINSRQEEQIKTQQKDPSILKNQLCPLYNAKLSNPVSIRHMWQLKLSPEALLYIEVYTTLLFCCKFLQLWRQQRKMWRQGKFWLDSVALKWRHNYAKDIICLIQIHPEPNLASTL